jgi:hypothetical protein
LLQDAEEAFSFGVKLIEIQRFGHEDIGSCLKDLLFRFGLTADSNYDGLVAGVGFDPPANFDSIDARNHNIENEEIGFGASDLDQRTDSVSGCTDFIAALALKVGFQNVGDFFFVFDYEDAEFSFDKRLRRGNLMLAEEGHKVFPPDSPMAAWSPI